MGKIYKSLLLAIVAVTLFAATVNGADKKVLFIDSYHEGYAWSDGILKGIKKAIGDKAELKVIHMDTKRNTSEDFKKSAAEKAKKVIEEWKPNVVIAADDNASKYLIAPYFKDKELPFVFCGVNWNASIYGFPTKNICGMEEVALIKPLLDQIKQFAKGEKIGFIAPDIATAHKEKENVEKKFNLKLHSYFAKNFEDWKKGYKELQGSCDIVIVDSDGGLYKDNAKEMKEFVLNNTTKPTGSCYDFMAPYAFVSFTKLAEEQGEWAATSALKILSGESPEKIGVTQNKKGKLFINMALAKKLNITIPMELIEQATIIK